jgi:hypothetical protein
VLLDREGPRMTRMRLIAQLSQGEATRKILRHLALPDSSCTSGASCTNRKPHRTIRPPSGAGTRYAVASPEMAADSSYAPGLCG